MGAVAREMTVFGTASGHGMDIVVCEEGGDLMEEGPFGLIGYEGQCLAVAVSVKCRARAVE